MSGFRAVFKRELLSYFRTPLAYVFLVIFIFASAYLTFKDNWFEAGQASLAIFFQNMPTLFLFLVPAMAMRLWAEERRSNSVELLFTLPVTTPQAVLGKFFAAWAMLLLALALTFPMVVTVAVLGDPDPGPIATGYLACALLAGAYLGIGSFFSALTRNQVIAFVLGVVAGGAFLVLGHPSTLDFLTGHDAPQGFLDALEGLSFQIRFESLMRGVVEIRDVLFFLLLTAGWLWANMVMLDERRAA